MSVAEINARLNVQLTNLKAMFETAGIQQHSIVMLEGLIKDKKPSDFLTLIEGFGQSMAFVDHDELVNRLVVSWDLVLDSLNAEKKAVKKKIAALKEDKKSDPDVLAKQENLLVDVFTKRATSLIAVNRLRAMQTIALADFKNPVFDSMSKYLEVQAAQKGEKK